jgi:peptide chain release factor 1
VGVLPLFEFKGKPLNEAEIEVTTQKGKVRAGGQNANKVNSAVRAKHLPTGLSVFINGRDQHQNKSKALEILTAKVNHHLHEKAHSRYAAEKKDQLGNSCRGEKIRIYDFKRNCAEDTRSGKSINLKAFTKGNLDLLA